MPTKIQDHSRNHEKYIAIGRELRDHRQALGQSATHPELQRQAIDLHLRINDLLEAQKRITLEWELFRAEQCYNQTVEQYLCTSTEDDKFKDLELQLAELTYRMVSIIQILDEK